MGNLITRVMSVSSVLVSASSLKTPGSFFLLLPPGEEHYCQQSGLFAVWSGAPPPGTHLSITKGLRGPLCGGWRLRRSSVRRRRRGRLGVKGPPGVTHVGRPLGGWGGHRNQHT